MREHITDTIHANEFDADPSIAALRREGTDDWMMIFTLAGEGRFGTPTGDITLRPLHAILIRPGIRHDYHADRTVGRWHHQWVHVHPRPHWLGWMEWPEIASGIGCVHLDRETAGGFTEDLASAIRWVHSGDPFSVPRAMHHVEAALIRIAAWRCSQRAGLDARIERAQHFISEHMSERLPVAKVARHVGLGEHRLMNLFRLEVGMTLARWIEAERMRRARELLINANLPVAQVAALVGYGDPFHFARRYRQLSGHPPSTAKAHAAAGRVGPPHRPPILA